MSRVRVSAAMSLALAAVLGIQASSVLAKGGGHHSAPRPHRPSVHHSTPRHVSRPAPHPHATAHKAVVHNTTRTFRKTTPTSKPHYTANKTTTGNTSTGSTTRKTTTTNTGASSIGPRATGNNFASRANYRRPNSNVGYYGRRHSYSPGMYRYRSSRYMRRHHRNRNRHQPTVVQGIVTGTNGQASNGTVQVKVLASSNNRFRNRQRGVGANNNAVAANGGAANNAANPKAQNTRNFQVNNGTRYLLVSSQGTYRNSSFKALAPGEPVLVLLGNRSGGSSNFAQAIDIFPKNKKLLAAAAPPQQ